MNYTSAKLLPKKLARPRRWEEGTALVLSETRNRIERQRIFGNCKERVEHISGLRVDRCLGLVHGRAWVSWKDTLLRRGECYDLNKERQIPVRLRLMCGKCFA